MERIVTLVYVNNPQCSVTKDVGFSTQLSIKFGSNVKRNKNNGALKKGKQTGRPRQTSKCQERTIKTICFCTITVLKRLETLWLPSRGKLFDECKNSVKLHYGLLTTHLQAATGREKGNRSVRQSSTTQKKKKQKKKQRTYRSIKVKVDTGLEFCLCF